MSMSSIPSSSPGGKRYGWVEKIGTKVPHPFLLFIYLIVALIAATAILSAFNVGCRTLRMVHGWWSKICSAWKGCTGFLPNVIKNFSGFAPLGAILALVLARRLRRAGGSVTRADGEDGLSRQRPLCQLYGAVYRLLQPYLFRRGAGNYAAAGRADVPRRRSASCRRPVGGDCRCGLRLYRQFTDRHHRRTALGISTEAAKSIDASLHVSVIDNWYFYGDLSDRPDARRRTDHR